MSNKQLQVDILPQPNDVTCGPTCLHAIYDYYGDKVPLTQVIEEVTQLNSGGTLGVLLGQDALKRGFDVTIYTYNLQMFDPTWFDPDLKVGLPQKLKAQAKAKQTRRFKFTTNAYLHFLELGGKIRFEELTPALLKSFLVKEIPILTGLSATYLYNTAREIGETNTYDDVMGTPAGHFVVVSGYNRKTRLASVADPLNPNPISNIKQYYKVGIHRLINAILLGIVTYDANLLIIQPKS